MYIILFSMQQIGVESMPFSGLFNTWSPCHALSTYFIEMKLNAAQMVIMNMFIARHFEWIIQHASY